MKSKILFDLLYVVLIAFVIWLGISLFLMLKSHQKECLGNAFIYGADKQMKGEVHCDCIEVKDGRIYPFHFNDTAWWSDRVEIDPFQELVDKYKQ